MTTKFKKNGYGQLELNQFARRRDGRIEAQCKLNTVDFRNIKAENGMLLAIDNTTREIHLPTAENLAKGMVIGLNYSTEHMYGDLEFGLKDFALGLDDHLPRLGYLAVGDKFTTNTICFNSADEALGTEAKALKALEDLTKNIVYGKVSDIGYIELTSAKPEEGPVLKVIELTTMPDGQTAVKLQVLEA